MVESPQRSQRLESTHRDHVIRITPEDLSPPYIADLQVVRFLDGLDVHLDLFFYALWKHVLLVEILRHRYKVVSQVEKQNFFSGLLDRVRRDPGKRAALEYLNDFQDRFWCQTDERVREITERFEEKINAEAGGKLGNDLLGASASMGEETASSTEARRELADRFQRVVNQTQLGRLNKMLTVLDEDVLDSAQHYTYVVIDDLDRDWVDERLAKQLIRCLFRTVLDLKRVEHLKVLVALRTNIFEDLDFGLSGGQEEKFRSLILKMRWTPGDLVALLDERTRVAANLAEVGQMEGVADVLPRANKSRGNPVDFLIERTLLRPRDAIAFVNETLRLSAGKTRLSWEDLASAELPYSENRLLALRDEWKRTYPDIDRVVGLFAGTKTPIHRDELITLLDDAALLLEDPSFRGVSWMTQLSAPIWSAGFDFGWEATYQPLFRLFYTVGLLGVIRSRGARPLYSLDDPAFADRASNLADVEWFTVHPTYRAALDVRGRPRGRREEVPPSAGD